MNITKAEHHNRSQLCNTRPAYRQGRKLTAVKAYTINNESQHLFIYGVPQINLRSELKALCSKYGKILTIHVVADYETEVFTECYRVQYDRLQSARIAKRLLDDHSFYGSVLHVCYAPEYESTQETKQKLIQRFKDVLTRLPNQNFVGGLIYINSEKPVKIDSNFVKKKTDVYENDPIMSAYRKRKYDVLGKSTSSITLNQETSDTSAETHRDKKEQIKVISSSDSKRTTQALVPMQVMKERRAIDAAKKRIIFHNRKISM